MPRPKYEVITWGKVATSEDGTPLVFTTKGDADKEVRRIVREWRRSKSERTAHERCVAYTSGGNEIFGFVLKERGKIVSRVYYREVQS